MLRVNSLIGFGAGSSRKLDTGFVDEDIFFAPDVGPWQNSFATVLTDNTSSGWSGYTMRQVIDASMLTISGASVRLVIPASALGDFTIDTLYIGEQNSSGDPYDMKTTPQPTRFLVGGASTFTSDGVSSPIVTDPINFYIDETKTYVIAWHFATVIGQTAVICTTTGVTGANTYFKAATNEAAVADVSGYTAQAAGTLALVEKIQVLAPELSWTDTAVFTHSSEAGFRNLNVRVRIAAADLTHSGDYVRFELASGALSAGFTVDAISIGQQASSGDNFDMKTTPTPAIITTPYSIGPNDTLITEKVAFHLDNTVNHVIAFHIADSPNCSIRYGAAGDGTINGTLTYTNNTAGPSEAATANVSGYDLNGAYVFLIKRVQVASDSILAPALNDTDVFYTPVETGGWHNSFTMVYDSNQSFGPGTSRQVLHFSDVMLSGSSCRLVLAAGAGSFTVTEMWIGEQNTAGDPYDMRPSSPTPVQVMFGGSATCSATAGQTVVSDTISFAIDETRSYVISFYGSGSNVEQGINQFHDNATQFYGKATVNEAATANVTGYSSGGGNVCRLITYLQV